MIELSQTSHVYEDCTASYEVTMDDEYTVEDFISEVLDKASEWGTIRVHSSNGIHSVEYSCGEATMQLHKRTAHAYVRRATAHGGWRMMDYDLYI